MISVHAYIQWPNSMPFISPLCHFSTSRNNNSLFMLSFCCCFRPHVGDRTRSWYFYNCVISAKILQLCPFSPQLNLFLFWLNGNTLWLCCKLFCTSVIDRCLLRLSISATVTGAAKNTKLRIPLWFV